MRILTLLLILPFIGGCAVLPGFGEDDAVRIAMDLVVEDVDARCAGQNVDDGQCDLVTFSLGDPCNEGLEYISAIQVEYPPVLMPSRSLGAAVRGINIEDFLRSAACRAVEKLFEMGSGSVQVGNTMNANGFVVRAVIEQRAASVTP